MASWKAKRPLKRQRLSAFQRDCRVLLSCDVIWVAWMIRCNPCWGPISDAVRDRAESLDYAKRRSSHKVAVSEFRNLCNTHIAGLLSRGGIRLARPRLVLAKTTSFLGDGINQWLQ